AWCGGAGAQNTASVLWSFAGSSRESYVFFQRVGVARPARPSGKRALTATTSTLGRSWDSKDAPSLQKTHPPKPTRIFRSETGSHPLDVSADAFLIFSKP